jgi:hypothetical protein
MLLSHFLAKISSTGIDSRAIRNNLQKLFLCFCRETPWMLLITGRLKLSANVISVFLQGLIGEVVDSRTVPNYLQGKNIFIFRGG